jgi:hypothetical protein
MRNSCQTGSGREVLLVVNGLHTWVFHTFCAAHIIFGLIMLLFLQISQCTMAAQSVHRVIPYERPRFPTTRTEASSQLLCYHTM